MSISKEFLQAFLFGSHWSDDWVTAPFKRAGVYHILVYSGSHVIFWCRFFRRLFLECFGARYVWEVEGIIWIILGLMYSFFDQGWPALRALMFWIMSEFLGLRRRSLSCHLGVLCLVSIGLFLLDLSAWRMMGPWMSLAGSLLLILLSRDSSESWGEAALLFCFVSAVEWCISLIFGVYYYFLLSLFLGISYSLMASRFFFLFIGIYLAILIHQPCQSLFDRWLLSFIQMNYRIVQWYSELF